MRSLVQSCAEFPDTDSLTVSSNGDGVEMTVHDGSKYAVHMMDEERARELFNWLGVWLHKGGVQ